MSKNNISGRRDEIRILERVLTSSDPEFIAVYGRRRVGKTWLVREFFGDLVSFEITGMHHVTLQDQLSNFAQSLGKAAGMALQPQRPSSWSEAFGQLEQLLESSLAKEEGKKQVVFLDELPWLNTPRSQFLSALEHFWNSYGSRKKNLILVVCGSAASWMLQNIVRAKGGLHNRLTRQIRLLPFTLAETEEFLLHRQVSLTRYQIVELFMVMGGVPFYLMQAEPGLSAYQIIDKVCFSATGLLRTEYEKLYASLFEESDLHLKIVALLAKKRTGLGRNEIASAAKLTTGGRLTRVLDELEESGFIESRTPYGKKVNDLLYRLVDEFTLFYFSWIKPLGKKIPDQGYWMLRQNSPSRKAWSGFAFETLCIKHVRQLKAALGIAMVETSDAPWRYQAGKDSVYPDGAQIDLLIDRSDATINLCEIKFSQGEFTVDASYAKELRRKIDVFRQVTKTRKNIFLTMITTYGVTDNIWRKDVVANVLTLDALF
ncbi:MAG: ATP-binding protein [Chlorobiaceae bacterium]